MEVIVMDAYRIGLMSGFLGALVLLVVVMLLKRKRQGGTAYDERQAAIRGRGYKYAYITAGLLTFVYAIFFEGIAELYIEPGLVLVAILLLSGLVLSGYCIFKDAYWGYNQHGHKSMIVCWGALVVFFLAQAISKIMDGKVIKNGRISFDGGLPFVMAAFFLVFLCMQGLKLIIDKRDAE